MARSVKYIEKETKPIPILEDWRRVRENMEILCVNTVILKEGKRNRNVNSYRCEEK